MSESVVVLGALIAVCMIGLAFVLFRRGAREREPSIMRPPLWPENGA